MVRENRIKNFTFSVGSLTTDAAGQINVYSDYPLNGTIKKIGFEAGNYTATGSIFISISGVVSEPVWEKINNVNADSIAYPIIYTEDKTGTTGSPDAYTSRVINSTIRIQSSGCGSGKSGLGLSVYYI
mgnify:CR=1 FL=1